MTSYREVCERILSSLDSAVGGKHAEKQGWQAR